MAVIKDLVIEQGETVEIPHLWRNKLTGVPIDLTGCSIFLQGRKEKASTSQLLLDASTVNGKIVIDADPTTGVFTITLPATYTSALQLPKEPLAPTSRALFELVVVFPDTTVIKLRKGNIIFNGSVYYP